MKRFFSVAAAAAIVFATAGTTAWAAQAAQGTVGITASVTAKCSSLSGGPLAFTIDPSTGLEAGSTGADVTVQCTKRKDFTVTALSAGAGGAASDTSPLAGKLKATGYTDIPYSLYFTEDFTGNGFGAATASTLVTAAGSSSGGTGAVVAAAAAQAAEAGGDYSDTVTLTISY